MSVFLIKLSSISYVPPKVLPIIEVTIYRCFYVRKLDRPEAIILVQIVQKVKVSVLTQEQNALER